MTRERFDKLCIADEMLDAAIEAFFAGRCFAAVNNAGVAQELYAKMLSLQRLGTYRDQLIGVADTLTLRAGMEGLPVGHWNREAGRLKNAIKHIDNKEDRYVEADAQDEARSGIFEAIGERDRLDRPHSPVVDRFCEYATALVRQVQPPASA